MWKSPPKTVLLLKKLGDELMEEAKEVHAEFSLLVII
jgi:NAD+ kinase